VKSGCQEAIAKAGLDMIKRRMQMMQRCRDGLNDGKLLVAADGTTPIHGAGRLRRREKRRQSTDKAVAKARTLLSKRCYDPIVDDLPTCGNSIEELVSADGTGGCLRDSQLGLADDMTNAAYGVAPTTEAAHTCQLAIARAGLTYVTKALKAEQKCRDRVNDGRALFLDAGDTQSLSSSADCSNEWDTQRSITKLALAARTKIGKSSCDAATLGALQTCAATVDGLINPAGTAGV
jgi:hypothetical protein